MSEDPYERLRELMDQFPIGFPKTEFGVELKILKRLFTEEQAEIAALLSPFPKEAAQIASARVRTEGRAHGACVVILAHVSLADGTTHACERAPLTGDDAADGRVTGSNVRAGSRCAGGRHVQWLEHADT